MEKKFINFSKQDIRDKNGLKRIFITCSSNLSMMDNMTNFLKSFKNVDTNK